MKARADRERGGGVRVLIVSLIKPWEAQGGWEMRWEVSELNVRSGRDVADFHEAYAHTHWEVERGSSAQSSVSYYPLNFSSPSRSIAPLSLCHSPSFALPIFPPITPKLLVPLQTELLQPGSNISTEKPQPLPIVVEVKAISFS